MEEIKDATDFAKRWWKIADQNSVLLDMSIDLLGKAEQFRITPKGYGQNSEESLEKGVGHSGRSSGETLNNRHAMVPD
jgi:hypothetical protein